MGNDVRQKIASRSGPIRVKGFRDFLLRVIDDDPMLAPAIRRFVYCWGKLGNDWTNFGMFMTDDDGFLIDLTAYVVEAFGNTDLLQKLHTDTVTAFKIGTQFDFTDTGNYRIVFKKEFDYFLMFCPPDIIDKGSVPGKFSSPQGQSQAQSNTSSFKDNPYLNRKDNTSQSDALSNANLQRVEADAKMTKAVQDIDAQLKFWSAPHAHWTDECDKKCTFGKLIDRGQVPTTPSNAIVDKLDNYQKFKETYKENTEFLKTVSPNNAIKIPLPITLEEYLSRLAYFTHILDIQYASYLEAGKPFLEVNAKLFELEQLLVLMRDCPGFKLTDTNETGEKHNVGGDEITFHISYPSTLNTGNNNGPKPSYLRRQTTIADRTSIGDFAEKVRLFRESVLTGAKTDNNEAYKEGKKNVNAAANEVISVLSDIDFMERIDSWTEYLNEYSTKNVYPYSIKQSTSNESIMYRVIQQAIVTLIAIDFDDGKTENRYKTLVAALIEDIVSVFDEEDKKQGYMKTFLAALEESHVAKGLSNKDKELIVNTRKTPSENKNTTVLQRVFSNQLIKDVIPGIWNNQGGMSSNLTAILKICRALHSKNSIKTGVLIKSAVSIVQIYRIEFGAMILCQKGYVVSASQLKIEIKTVIRQNISKTSIVSSPKMSTNQIFESDDIGAAPKSINAITSAIGAVVSLWGIWELAVKCSEKDYKVTNEDFIDFALKVHGAGTALTGIDFAWLAEKSNIRQISDISQKIAPLSKLLLKFNSAVALYSAFQSSQEAVKYEQTGDTVCASLSWYQTSVSFINSGLALAALLTGSGYLHQLEDFYLLPDLLQVLLRVLSRVVKLKQKNG